MKKLFVLSLAMFALSAYGVMKISNSSAQDAPVVSGGIYRLLNHCSGKALDVSGRSNGGNALIWSWVNDPSQQFQINDAGNGYYNLLAQSTGRALTVEQGRTADGTNIEQRSYSGSNQYQQWQLVPAQDGRFHIVARHSGKLMSVAASSTQDGANVLQWSSAGTCGQRWLLDPISLPTAPTSVPPTATAIPPTATAVPPTETPATLIPPTATAVPPTPVPPTPTPESGRTAISNPNGNCISIDGRQNVVIENVDIGPCGGHGIYINNSSNVTIRNVTVKQSASSITAHRSSNITVDGVFSTETKGPMPRGQHVMFDKVDGGVIRNVTTRHVQGTGFFQEDAINAYWSQRILIENNDVGGGTSNSGCGIIVDGPWSEGVTIRNNIVRNQANCGIGIANGTGHIVEANDVGGYGNVGIYVWNQYEGPCGDVLVARNTVYGGNAFWEGQNCRPLTLEANIFPQWPYYSECSTRCVLR